MKKFVIAAVAASLVASPAMAAAPNHYRDARPAAHKMVVKKAYKPAANHRSWNRGDRFDSRYARNYRQVDHRQYRGLKAPPRGYRYVQSGNDAVLVGITSGIVAAVIANLIR